jgi:AhpD family alkylhydroperoxidase
MSTNAQEYYANNPAAMKSARAAMPEVFRGFSGLHQATIKDGAVPVKEKELIALGIGLAVRCEPCIYAHVEAALKAGATAQEIIETAGVAVLMQGGPTYTYLPRVTEALEALAEPNPV